MTAEELVNALKSSYTLSVIHEKILEDLQKERADLIKKYYEQFDFKT